MNGIASSASRFVRQGVLGSGLLYHIARAHEDGTRKYTPSQSLHSMARSHFIQGQATKGYFARMEGVRAVSFTGASLDRLDKLVGRRRSEFGICFDRRRIDPSGEEIKPIHYLDRATIERIRFKNRYPEGLSPEDRYWIDLDEPGTYSFPWEEEWRKLGDLKFEHDSVVFLIAPLSSISAELFALGHMIIPSAAIYNPFPHMQRVAELVAIARERAPKGKKVNEAAIEDGYLVHLAHEQTQLLYSKFQPKIRADMRGDVEHEIYTASGELRDPNGEWNPFEASMFDLDNQLDALFEDED